MYLTSVEQTPTLVQSLMCYVPVIAHAAHVVNAYAAYVLLLNMCLVIRRENNA
jgi:hypothetical protein